ncbi:hypothetical protein SAMN06265337_2333 [Hymenobacter gelipurpurascens]|uniref:Uncharacterized protein n=1 Tax=Hymenobacter gelipurpurascens TaxID=89968 RepID=A0A212TR48_9BACT|nr:hypothetical protein SAMN06265337_2333 [Hymenobacter gelipurpurascens]
MVTLWKTGQRWRILHGTKAPAKVYQHLGKEGSGSSGVYYLLVKYQHRQGNALQARVVTDRYTHDSLQEGATVKVCYFGQDHQNTLLATEWAFSGQLMVISAGCLLCLFDSISTNREWRNRRPDGYLAD